jgi:hypothetical protein
MRLVAPVRAREQGFPACTPDVSRGLPASVVKARLNRLAFVFAFLFILFWVLARVALGLTP